MYSLFIMLSIKPKEHVRGSSLIILSKLPSRHLNLHGLKDLAN